MPLIIPSNSISDGGYEVANSLRFDDGSTDRLRRTPSSAGNRRTFTFSTWVKRSALGSDNRSLICATVDDGNKTMLRFTDSDELRFVRFTSGGATNQLITNAKFRDVSAWYHIVIAVDTTNSTAGDRLRLYVNGSEITSFSTESQPTQNYDYDINNTEEHNIGYGTDNNNHLFDGYMAEVVLIDGSQLDPTSFGEFDEDSSIWKPIDVSGLTFGTNGFYLDFENSGSLGADVSGNGNNFTVNNLTSIDQTTDTCTNNFCTLNSIHPTASNFTLSDGNTSIYKSGTGQLGGFLGTIMPTTGKWYWEVKIIEAANSDRTRVGVANYESVTGTSTIQNNYSGFEVSCNSNHIFVVTNGSTSETNSSGSSTDGDILQFAMDLDNKAIYLGRNGTFVTLTATSGGDPTSGASKTGAMVTDTTHILNGSPMCVYFGHYAGASDVSNVSFNFGNPPFTISSGNSDGNGYGNFEYSVPSGYYALNTKNLAEYG